MATVIDIQLTEFRSLGTAVKHGVMISDEHRTEVLTTWEPATRNYDATTVLRRVLREAQTFSTKETLKAMLCKQGDVSIDRTIIPSTRFQALKVELDVQMMLERLFPELEEKVAKLTRAEVVSMSEQEMEAIRAYDISDQLKFTRQVMTPHSDMVVVSYTAVRVTQVEDVKAWLQTQYKKHIGLLGAQHWRIRTWAVAMQRYGMDIPEI